MKPFSLLVILVGIWAITNLWWIPLTKAKWKASGLRQKIARAGTLTVLEKVRDLAIIGSITMLSVIVFVVICGALATTSSVPSTVLLAVSSTYSVLKEWSDTYSTWVGMLAFVGTIVALYLAARKAKSRVVEAWSLEAGKVFSEFSEDPRILASASRDPELQPLVERLNATYENLEHLQSRPQGADVLELVNERRAEIGEILSAIAIETARKRLDLEAALARPATGEEASPASIWGRIQRVLASERLAKDLGLVRKPISYVLTGLLVVTLVGWTSEPMADSMRMAVNNLRVAVFSADTSKDTETVLSHIASAKDPEPDEAGEDSAQSAAQSTQLVQHASRLLARATIDHLLHSTILEQPDAVARNARTGVSTAGRTAPVARSTLDNAEFVRAAILDQELQLPDNASSIEKLQTEVAEEVRRIGDGPASDKLARVQTSIEKEIEPLLERVHASKPGLLNQIAERLEGRYARPIMPLDAHSKVVAEMLTHAFAGVNFDATTEAGRQGQRLLKDLGKETVKTWVNGVAKSQTADILFELARPEVTRLAPDFSFEKTERIRALAADMHRASLSERIWTAAPAARQNAAVSESLTKIASKMAFTDLLNANQAAVRQGLVTQTQIQNAANMSVETLGGYDSLFPSDFSTNSGGGGGHSSARDPAASFRMPATRKPATSFHRMSMSFRVRGVIIGRDLPAAGTDISGLRWKLLPAENISPTRIELDAYTGEVWKRLGTFDAAVVNQALRYAADSRVIAATIVGGDGRLLKQAIDVHPALIDTPLGCRIVEADRFVDTFTLSDERSADIATLSADREQMYRWLQVMNVAEDVAGKASESEKQCLARMKTITEKGNAAEFSPLLSRKLVSFIGTVDGKQGGSAELLRNANQCAMGPMVNLAACLCGTARANGLQPRYWFPEDHTSQVRERVAAIGPGLSWLDRSRSRLENMDFWVHTTFAVRDSSAESVSGDEDTGQALDFPKEDLDKLQRGVLARLPDYLAGRNSYLNPMARSYEDFMGPIEDFILLQRFVRAAFSGSLGKRFPLPELIQLERASRPFVPQQPTIRWNPKVQPTDFIKELRAADSKAAAIQIAWERDFNDRIERKKRPMCDPVSK